MDIHEVVHSTFFDLFRNKLCYLGGHSLNSVNESNSVTNLYSRSNDIFDCKFIF